MKHAQCRITAAKKRIISKYKCTGYARKFINQKGFGQGMGATNAQNRVTHKTLLSPRNENVPRQFTNEFT